MTRSKKWGVCFLVTPFLGLALILVAWAVTSFVIGQMITAAPPVYQAPTNGAPNIRLAQSDTRSTTANIINVALGFVGLIFVLMIPFGLLIGIILLVKKDAVQQLPSDSASNSSPTTNQVVESTATVVPPETSPSTTPTEAPSAETPSSDEPTPPEAPSAPAV